MDASGLGLVAIGLGTVATVFGIWSESRKDDEAIKKRLGLTTRGFGCLFLAVASGVIAFFHHKASEDEAAEAQRELNDAFVSASGERDGLKRRLSDIRQAQALGYGEIRDDIGKLRGLVGEDAAALAIIVSIETKLDEQEQEVEKAPVVSTEERFAEFAAIITTLDAQATDADAARREAESQLATLRAAAAAAAEREATAAEKLSGVQRELGAFKEERTEVLKRLAPPKTTVAEQIKALTGQIKKLDDEKAPLVALREAVKVRYAQLGVQGVTDDNLIEKLNELVADTESDDVRITQQKLASLLSAETILAAIHDVVVEKRGHTPKTELESILKEWGPMEDDDSKNLRDSYTGLRESLENELVALHRKRADVERLKDAELGPVLVESAKASVKPVARVPTGIIESVDRYTAQRHWEYPADKSVAERVDWVLRRVHVERVAWENYILDAMLGGKAARKYYQVEKEERRHRSDALKAVLYRKEVVTFMKDPVVLAECREFFEWAATRTMTGKEFEVELKDLEKHRKALKG